MTQSIARQSDHDLGGAGSILVRQRQDHARLDVLLHRVHATTGITRRSALNDLARLVFPHAFAEESVLWPLARRTLGDSGHGLTTEIEQEHQQINRLWSDLETLAQDDPRYDAALAALTDLLQRDVRDEEDRLLPLLQQALTPGQLRRVGFVWAAVNRTAPTRPHAVVARRPPGNVLAALPLTVLDRARDAADRTARANGRRAGTARRVSGGLAIVAGRVERAPGMRRGETASTREP